MSKPLGLRDALVARADQTGLVALGFASAAPFVAARQRIEQARFDGLSDGMQFTFRNPERSTTPRFTLANARTVIVGAWAYPMAPIATEVAQESMGRAMGAVAAYAVNDHYADLEAALTQVAERLIADGWQARVVLDDNALVDRAAARRAGLGWSGRNTNLLLPGRGSMVVLGSIITDAALRPDTEIADGCGTCGRCIDSCPTGALTEDGRLDAARCLAWLLQKPGSFPVEFREALGTRIYGCDECQVSCPPNRVTMRNSSNLADAGLDLLDLLQLDDAQLLELVGRWYVPDRDPDVVRRNALIALGNSPLDQSNRTETAAVLNSTAVRSELLAEHAQWAAQRLGLALT